MTMTTMTSVVRGTTECGPRVLGIWYGNQFEWIFHKIFIVTNLFGLKVYCFETNSCVYEDGRCDHDDDNYEHGGPDRVWISCPTGSVSVHFAALRMIVFIIMILCMGA